MESNDFLIPTESGEPAVPTNLTEWSHWAFFLLLIYLDSELKTHLFQHLNMKPCPGASNRVVRKECYGLQSTSAPNTYTLYSGSGVTIFFAPYSCLFVQSFLKNCVPLRGKKQSKTTKMVQTILSTMQTVNHCIEIQSLQTMGRMKLYFKFKARLAILPNIKPQTHRRKKVLINKTQVHKIQQCFTH